MSRIVLRVVIIAALFACLACSFYRAEYITPTETNTTTFVGFGEFIDSPTGLRLTDRATSHSLFRLNDAYFIRANPLQGESEPTDNLFSLFSSLFNAAVSVFTILL